MSGYACCAPAPSHAARLDGAGAHRSGPLCPLAVSADCPPGWHPFLRINQGAKFRPARRAGTGPRVGRAGRQCWRGGGTAFRSRDCHLECTLVAWWGEGHEEPWFILTDLAPAGCDASRYGLRTWCEQSFKRTKRGGWEWQYTQMTSPARAARLWLALAVATLWMISVGSDLEVGPPPECADLPDLRPLLGLPAAGKPRRTRLFRLGGGSGFWYAKSPPGLYPFPGGWCRSLGRTSPYV